MYVPFVRLIPESMMSRSLASLLAVLLLSTACGRAREDAGESAAADSTRAVAPAASITDSAAPESVSLPVGAPSTPPPAAPTANAAKPSPSPYIGHDSAFGPSYEVDSTGKVTPIRVKKPVQR
jgi:hypothetical protein